MIGAVSASVKPGRCAQFGEPPRTARPTSVAAGEALASDSGVAPAALDTYGVELILSVFAAFALIGLIAWIPFQRAASRQRALIRLLEGADEMERLLHRTRERMSAMQAVVGRVPADIGAVARASLDADQRVQQALRDLLEHRLWISRHGATASLQELKQAEAALQRARATIASQLERLESAGAELDDATQAVIEQAAREPASLRRAPD